MIKKRLIKRESITPRLNDIIYDRSPEHQSKNIKKRHRSNRITAIISRESTKNNQQRIVIIYVDRERRRRRARERGLPVEETA